MYLSRINYKRILILWIEKAWGKSKPLLAFFVPVIISHKTF
jgi:hypothetical protein